MRAQISAGLVSGIMMVSSAFATGCSGEAIDVDTDLPAVNGLAEVTIDGAHSVEVGCELALRARTLGGVDSGYAWRTRDDLVATIDHQGVLTPLVPGETSVVARGLDTGAIGEHSLTVTDDRQPGGGTEP